MMMTLAELPAQSLRGAGKANGAEAVDEQLPAMAVSAASSEELDRADRAAAAPTLLEMLE